MLISLDATKPSRLEEGTNLDVYPEVTIKMTPTLFKPENNGLYESLCIAWEDSSPEPKAIGNFYSNIEVEAINHSLYQLCDKQQLDIRTAVSFIMKIKASVKSGKFTQTAYEALRAINYLSGFEFANYAREYYRTRQNVATNHIEDQVKNTILEKFFEDGYLIIAPSELSRKLVEFLSTSLNKSTVTREVDGKVGNLSDLIMEDIPDAFRFNYFERDLPIGEVMHFLKATGALHFIDLYLGNPILRGINAWFSKPARISTTAGKSLAAQMFHHDNDVGLGWLKVFIYLTDVDKTSGPHVFVPGSHRLVPREFRRDGRFSDDEVFNAYKRVVTVTGEKGTVIIGDTQCLHKGLEPESGTRTVVQLEFCNSLFGQLTPTHQDPEKALLNLQQFGFRLLFRYLRDLDHLSSTPNVVKH
jgi:hypothetical protein